MIVMILSLTLNSCVRIKVWMDNSGIKGYSEMILKEYDSKTASISAEVKNDARLSTTTRAARIHTVPMREWRLDGIPLQRQATFPSYIKQSDGNYDTAIFYIYSQTELKGSDVILWIPGFGVSDFAFRFIKTFFKNELAAGYTVVFYNIPYHLGRIEQGKEAGEGLVTASNETNLENISQILDEIKVINTYLRSNGVKSVSGWGGSIGAVFLWLSSEQIQFRHMTLMIPVVDWNTLVFHPHMSPVREVMNQSGISDSRLKDLYSAVSPINTPTLTDPDRIQILYAKYDQFTPERKTLLFAEKWNIQNVIGYQESHASILINSQMYKDNKNFISRMRN